MLYGRPCPGAGPQQAGAPATALPALTEAEVRKVDKEAAKLTLRHGPIVNLDKPAMTMVFRMGDPAFLEAVKPGDKIHVHIEKVGGNSPSPGSTPPGKVLAAPSMQGHPAGN